MAPFVNIYINCEVIAISIVGQCGLQDARNVIEQIIAQPQYNRFLEVIFDLRDLNCLLSTSEIYRLTKFVAWPGNKLPSCRRIAVVISEEDRDCTDFLVLCARSRGLLVESFRSVGAARDWLQAKEFPIAF